MIGATSMITPHFAWSGSLQTASLLQPAPGSPMLHVEPVPASGFGIEQPPPFGQSASVLHWPQVAPST
jgi:hypothetical protein